MPVIHNYNYNEIPAWAELKKWEIRNIPVGGSLTVETGHTNCGVYLLNGKIWVNDGKEKTLLWARMGQDVKQISLFNTGNITIECSLDDNWWNQNTVAIFSGDWGDNFARMGGFTCSNTDDPFNHGDPVDFKFFTSFPNHYHEFDEYFLVMQGRGVWMDNGKLYNVEPGDLIATRRGQHHQVVACYDATMTCAEFGSRMGGKGRTAFLYEHTDGMPLCQD